MLTSKRKTRDKGRFYENMALEFLQSHQLSLIVKNYLTQFGEIDLIMRKDSLLCFIEVRYRKQTSYGGAEASVTRDKQAKIKRTAEYFLMKNPSYQHFTCRFDVVAISSTDNNPTINWIPSAFI